ncbi:MAG TPA: prepilin peptidase [Trinickia sp.]|jgi:prepilin peptidase CpaA|nr:prepilin peptidase [Trinickia sp.]
MWFVKALACGVLAMLALSDLRLRRLPNVGVVAFAALYFVQAVCMDSGRFAFGAFEAHAATGALALVLAALLFSLGWLGGGDAKLAAAVFLWAGPAHAAAVFLIVSVSGLMVGIAVLATGVALRRHQALTPHFAWLAPARGVPYGVALALGGALAVSLPLQSAPRATSTLAEVSLNHLAALAPFHHARPA